MELTKNNESIKIVIKNRRYSIVTIQLNNECNRLFLRKKTVKIQKEIIK